MRDTMAEVRDLDRQLNAATEPAEMRRLIARRRLVRSGMDFERAVREIGQDLPLGPIEPFCKSIDAWRALGRL